MGTARSSIRRGAAIGAGAGLLACAGGVSYFLENRGIPNIDWSTVATVFVAQLVLTGALAGAAMTAALRFVEGRRAPIATAIAMAVVGAPSGAFGASYFGALHAPFMGTTVIFAIVSVVAIALAIAIAWLEKQRLGRATLAALGLALPIVAIGGLCAAAMPERDVLHAFRTTSVPLLGGATGAVLAFVYGLYAGGVVGLVRRGANAPKVEERPRLRVEAPKVEEEIDPLAEEEDELLARFAELERSMRARP